MQSNEEFKKQLITRAFQFALAKDIAPTDVSSIDILLQETGELAKILGSSIVTLKEKRDL